MSKYKWIEEVNKYSMPELTYDNNGNILTLQRNSIVNTTLGNMDNLTYTYKGNRLLGVNDASNNTEGFNDNGFTDVVIPEQENTHEYSYDNNGNMTQDLNKGVEYIKYNYLNKPYYISFNRSNYITYIYDAAGTKLKKTVHYNGTETSTDYVGDFVYHENTLSFAASEAGRITPQADGSFRNEYIIADHQPVGRQVLGNTRTLFTDANSDRIPEILQENHYDPFGMAIGNLSYETPDGNNKYKYNGKELQDDLGLNWYDYGARMYDAAIGRWHVVDPMAGKYYSWSPYNYCFNNPVKLVDPDGKGPGDPPLSQVFKSEQLEKYGPVAAELAISATSVAAAAIFTVSTGPVGYIYGPTSLGLATAKFIGKLNPKIFDQAKVNKAPNTLTGVVSGAATHIFGGDFSKGAHIGDLIQSAGEFTFGVKVTNGIDFLGQTLSGTEIIKSTIPLIDKKTAEVKKESTETKVVKENSTTSIPYKGVSNNTTILSEDDTSFKQYFLNNFPKNEQ